MWQFSNPGCLDFDLPADESLGAGTSVHELPLQRGDSQPEQYSFVNLIKQSTMIICVKCLPFSCSQGYCFRL